MVITGFGRCGALGKIFGVNGIASWVAAAHARYCKLARFPAYLGRLNAVRHWETRIGHAVMDPCHNLSPNTFGKAGSPVP